MNVVYLLLGSNLADRSALLKQACFELTSKIGPITGKSSVYESEPWGFQADQPFLNQVVIMETVFNPAELLSEIMKIELKLGRERDSSEGYTSRLIDIDILFFNDEVILQDGLIIPHPGISERMFTLLPLSELDKAFIHPVLHKSIGEMISECSDNLKVYLFHPS